MMKNFLPTTGVSNKALWVLLSLLSPLACAQSDVEKLLTEKVKSLLPDEEISAITETPVPGLFEIIVGGEILYLSADARYALHGELVDLDTRRNLTDERRAEGRVEAFKGLAADTLIEFAPDQTKNILYVFTDIDCSYCRRMHNEVGELNKAGVAVRYLAFPRAGIGSESYKKTVSVWCAKDSKEALTQAKLGGDVAAAECDNPVADQYALGQRLGVRGTPAVFLENGSQVGGYVPAEQLVKLFSDEP